MGGAAWNTNKKTDEELWDELVIRKEEYYDLEDKPTLEEYLEKVGPNPHQGMHARWGWYIEKKKEYNKLYKK